MTESLQAQAAAIRAGWARLGARDQDFAASLLDQLGRRGLSDKQAHWLGVLAQRASAEPQARDRRQIAADVGGILALFARVEGKLARPAISISSADAGEVRIAVAGEGSREPGTLAVTQGRYPERRWLGRIRPDGTWEPSRDGAAKAEAVGALLSRFAAAPAAVAAEHGRLTGACSFCSRPLSDARSTAAGFGPVCADRFGLSEEWASAQPALVVLSAA